ncbi:MAG: rod shape-determining protein RodA [Elusimicrobiaceae bacterium]|nr:rod shape-determining protein RodA [Elusimicrobiaceae bacterium]
MLNVQQVSSGRRRRLDYILLFAAASLVALGALCIMSAVNSVSFSNPVVRTHFLALPIGTVAFLMGWSFNYQIYDEQWKALYGFILILLVGVLLFGSYQRGSRSWFVLPFFSMQPSEICRVCTILVAAAFLDRRGARIREVPTLFWLSLLLLPIFGLIMMQPDFSSVVITLPALFILLYCTGANAFYLGLAVLFAAVAGFFTISWTYIYLHPDLLDYPLIKVFYGLAHNGWYMAGFAVLIALLGYGAWWLFKQFRIFLPSFYFVLATLVVLAGLAGAMVVEHQMKPHQRKRVETFLAPKSDPQGAGYNVLQAQIAMGAGGIVGKGLFSGTQSRLGFVPERHTDFILAVVGEELGLWGTLGVLGLYLLVLWRILSIAYMSGDRYGYLVCSGIFGMFFTYMLVNFGMLIGIVPVAGIPLPFISYGGSNLVASLWALGVVQSIYARRLRA